MTVFEATLDGGARASFRLLDPEADLELVHGWMHQPHVVPFWQLDLDRAGVAAYLRRAAADDHQHVLVGQVDGEPVSYGECFGRFGICWPVTTRPSRPTRASTC
jgi:hypothetical protein